MRLASYLVLSVWVLMISSGCTSSRTSDTARTGIEQLLISNAIDQTLAKTSLPAVQGRKVFLEDKYLDSVDKGYLVGSLRQKLLGSGARLVDKKEDSEITLEVVSGGIGTDNVESYLGVPGLSVPGMPIELPEVRLYEKSSQFGTAKISMVAYATESGEMLYDVGRHLARADDSSWSMFGVGLSKAAQFAMRSTRTPEPPTLPHASPIRSRVTQPNAKLVCAAVWARGKSSDSRHIFPGARNSCRNDVAQPTVDYDRSKMSPIEWQGAGRLVAGF